MWNGKPESRPRDSQPKEYWYTDIEEYYYNSDKIMMKNKVVFGINLLSHLPRAIEYANHRHDPAYQANLIKQEELENKRPEGASRYTDAIVAEKEERYNIAGKIYNKEEYEKYILEKLTKTAPTLTQAQENMSRLAKAMQGASKSASFQYGWTTTIEPTTKTVDYNLDEEEPKQDATIKTKVSKPKTPLKNRMKQLGRE